MPTLQALDSWCVRMQFFYGHSPSPSPCLFAVNVVLVSTYANQNTEDVYSGMETWYVAALILSLFLLPVCLPLPFVCFVSFLYFVRLGGT